MSSGTGWGDGWEAGLRAQHGGGDRGGRDHQAAGDPEGQVVAVGQGGRGRAVLRDQRVGPRRGDGGQHREPQRAADLGGRVHQAGGQARVLRGGAGHGQRHQGGEAQARAGADQQRDREDVAQVPAAAAGAMANRASPAAIRPRPGNIVVRAPKRMTSRSV